MFKIYRTIKTTTFTNINFTDNKWGLRFVNLLVTTASAVSRDLVAHTQSFLADLTLSYLSADSPMNFYYAFEHSPDDSDSTEAINKALQRCW